MKKTIGLITIMAIFLLLMGCSKPVLVPVFDKAHPEMTPEEKQAYEDCQKIAKFGPNGAQMAAGAVGAAGRFAGIGAQYGSGVAKAAAGAALLNPAALVTGGIGLAASGIRAASTQDKKAALERRWMERCLKEKEHPVIGWRDEKNPKAELVKTQPELADVVPADIGDKINAAKKRYKEKMEAEKAAQQKTAEKPAAEETAEKPMAGEGVPPAPQVEQKEETAAPPDGDDGQDEKADPKAAEVTEGK